MTTFIFLSLLIMIFTDLKFFSLLLVISLFVQACLEFNFLLVTKKMEGIKMFFYSIYVIQIWNLGIFFGFIYFCFNLLMKNNKN